MAGLFDDLIEAPAEGGLFDDLVTPPGEEYPDQVSRAASRAQPAATAPVELGTFGGETETRPGLLPTSVVDAVTRNAPAPTSLAGAGGFAAASAARNAEARAPAKMRTSTYDFETSAMFKGDDKEEEIGAFLGAVGMAKQYQGMRRALAELVGDEVTRDDAAAQRAMYEGKEEAARNDAFTPFEKNFSGAISSLTQQVPAMLGGLATGGARAVPLTSMWVATFGDEYAEGREKDQSKPVAAARAGVIASSEVLGEFFGIGHQMKAIIGAAKRAAPGEIAEHIAKGLLSDVPGEQLTNLINFVADKSETIGLKPKATLADFLQSAGDTLVQTILQSGMMAGTAGAVRTVSGLAQKGGTADLADQRVADFRAEQARTGALDKAGEMFGGMKPAAPGEAAPIEPGVPGLMVRTLPAPGRTVTEASAPPQGGIVDAATVDAAQAHADAVYAARDAEEQRLNRTQPRLPAPGQTVDALSAPPLPVTEVPAVDPAQAHAEAVYAARTAEEARQAQLARAGAPATATQAGEAPQTAASIQIDPADPSASIAAIAAAPITPITTGATTPAGIDPTEHANAAGDLARVLSQVEQARDAVKAAPKEGKKAAAAVLADLLSQARSVVETYRSRYGDEAANSLHVAAAETANAIRPEVQKRRAFMEREQEAALNAPAAAPPPVTLPAAPAAAPAGRVVAEAGDLPAIEMPVEAAAQQVAAAQDYPGAVEVTGVHYGTTPGLSTLSGSKYGTGASHAAGEESYRLKTGSPGIRQRVYFYEHDGLKLPEAEGVVTGTHAYEARLPGLLDVQTKEAQTLIKGVPRDAQGRLDLNAFEDAVLAAGYSGYKNGRQIVTLGRDVPVRYMGTRFEAAKALAPKSEAAKPAAKAEEKKPYVPPKRVPITVAYAPVKRADWTPLELAIVDGKPNAPLREWSDNMGDTTRDLTEAEKEAAAGIIRGLINTGVHPAMLDGITGFHAFTSSGSKADGKLVTFGKGREFAINTQYLAQVRSGNSSLVVVLFVHEGWHNVSVTKDGDGRWTNIAAQSPRLAISTKNGERVADGDIIKEVVDFFNAPTDDPNVEMLRGHFAYPLDDWGLNVDNRKETSSIQDETMAQLLSAWYTNPDAVRRSLPVAAQFLQEFTDAVKQEPATATLERIRGLASTALGNQASAGRAQQPGGPAGARAQDLGSGSEGRRIRNDELVAKEAETARDQLTPEEQERIRLKSSARAFINIFKMMPSSKETAAIAWAGKAKRGWYRNAAFALHHVFGDDAPRFAALLAATSPQTSVEDNLKASLQIWVLWVKAGRPQSFKKIEEIAWKGSEGTSIVTSTDKNNIIRALTHPNPAEMLISGPKVSSFHRNLMGNVVEVTNDAWMAKFGDVDAALFGGYTTPLSQLIVANEGKMYGYLAMTAHVRQAAKILTKLTGETWTPAEVQETVWSWAKTLYEKTARNRSMVDFLKSGELTDELIGATPDFGSLFSSGEYADILTAAGLTDGVEALRAARASSAGVAEAEAHTRAAREKAPFAPATQQAFEERAAARINRVREKRAEARAAEAEAERLKGIEEENIRSGETASREAQLIYDPEDPANANYRDFYESPEEAIRKPGWFIITGTVEGASAEDNDAANDKLRDRLKASGYDLHVVRGMWKGVDQGTSFLVFGPPEFGLRLARTFNQQAIATNKGFEYTDGRVDRADHKRDTFGAEARKQDGYTILPDGTAVSMGFAPSEDGYSAPGRANVTDSTKLAGDGRAFTGFFTAASEGKRAPNAKVPYTPVLNISSIKGFSDEYVKHRGNFDDHIATSIPGFREVQQAVGAAIVKAYPQGANLLDIAASEGAFNKAITATSDGKIKTLALDPNLAMAKFFKEHSTVPGAEYSIAAFGSAADAGQEAWTEPDGTVIKTFDPKIKYDVVHESMGFQFISNTRNAQFARVKEMMTPDGIALFEEKIIDNTAEWRANEKKKDAYKAKYYTDEQLAAKKAEVLEKGQAAADAAEQERESKIVGMNDLMTTGPELETALTNNWTHVVQYWDSGNFKGYVASDSRVALDRFVRGLTNLNSKYSTTKTPRTVTAGKGVSTADVEAQVAELTKDWKNAPQVTVLRSPKQAPFRAGKNARGAYHNGAVYLFTDNLSTAADVQFTALHEIAGHLGLRGVLGDALVSTLNRIYETNDAVRERASQLMTTLGYDQTRATEEALADMAGAGTAQQQSFWKQLVVAVRSALRKVGINVKISDTEIESLLADAYLYAKQGKQQAGGETAASEIGPLWYSALTAKVQASNTKSAPAAQWKATIKAMPGVKADEIEWTGINEWLDTQTGKVTKEQVLGYLSANGVQVTETMLGGVAPLPREVQIVARDMMDAIDNAEMYDAYAAGERASGRDKDEAAYNLSGALVRGAKRWRANGDSARAERMMALSRSIDAWLGEMHGEETQYEQYVLPGGTDYRELLLTLPRIPFNKTLENHIAFLTQRFESGGLERAEFDQAMRDPVEFVRENYPERDVESSFRSSHFTEPNILAHIRFNERIDAFGKRVLFIEEIQSDWGQAGRQKGFAVSGVNVAELNKKYDALNAERRKVEKIIATGDDAAQETKDAIARAAEIASEMTALSDLLASQRSGIRSAPFVSSVKGEAKTEPWVALAIKRMVRYAAENGFDRVAFVNGEQSAERYNLSKRIESLEIQAAKGSNVDGKYLLEAHALGDGLGGYRKVIDKVVSADELPDYVGKELAQRAIEDIKKSLTGYVHYTGIDLKVGGEGMKSFYDKIIPSVAKEVLKKLGGKLDSVAIFLPGDSEYDRLYPEQQEEAMMGLADDPEAWADLRQQEEQVFEQLGFDITDDMRNQALAGMPMFSILPPPAPESKEFDRWFKKSKAVDLNGDPDRFYHATHAVNDFDTFDTTRGEMGSHFGTIAQASSFVTASRSKARILPVYLSIQNPIRLIDKGAFGVEDVATQLFYEDIMPEADYNEAIRLFYDDYTDPREATKWMQGWLKQQGFDGIVYLNRREGGDYTDSFTTADLNEMSDYEFQREFPEARDSWIIFEPSQVKSAISNSGAYDPEAGSMSAHRAPTAPTWGAPDIKNPKFEAVVHALQDKHVDTKKVTAAINAFRGTPVPDAQDVYMQEELYHGRAAKQTDDFLRRELKPLITDMSARGVSLDDFETFLHNRHAEERNIQIAKVNPAMPDKGSGIATADARAYLAGLTTQQRTAFTALARRVDAIIAGTNRLLVSEGLESQDTINNWNRVYKNYVPLHREDADGSGQGTGQGYTVKGPSSKRATGSLKGVENVLSNLVMARERTIVRGAKNKVANALVGLAIANPNPDFWQVDVPKTISYIGPNGLVVHAPDPMWKNRDNVVTARVRDNNGNVTEHGVVFNPRNERAARMALSLKNLDAEQLGFLLGNTAKATRWFASVNTQFNPIFGIVNLARDTQQLMFNLTTTAIAGKQAQVTANILPALFGVLRDLRATRQGRAGTSAWAQTFEEFENAGGQTGYRDMFKDANERTKALAEEIKRLGRSKLAQSPRTAISWLGGWLSDYNTAMENATRVAAYKVARDNGVSIPRAASLAKNLTVNFNRKGAKSTQMGAAYAFFNASMQGTTRLVETLRGPRGKAILAGGILAGVLQAIALSEAGFDDDEPPEFERERNFIIPIGGKKYIKVPMPLGLHFLPNVGRIAAEHFISNKSTAADSAIKIASLFVDSFNPVGGGASLAQMVTPTAADPAMALIENKDWTGRPIERPNMNPLNPSPGHERAKETATPWAIAMSEAINYLTGGTDYVPGRISPTPDAIDYLIGQVGGGVMREVSKAATTVRAASTGEDLPPHKVPLVGRFYGESSGQAKEGGTFYQNVIELNKHEREIKGRKANGEDVEGYVERHPEAALVDKANKAERVVSKLRKQRREMVKSGADASDVAEIEGKITDAMRNFNELVKEARR